MPIASSLPIPSGEYRLDRAHASLVFRVRHLGLSNFTARFTHFDASVVLDADRPERSTLAVTVDPKSVRTDFPFPEKVDFDGEIANQFLRAAEFPEIRYRGTGLAATGANAGDMAGELTLLGVTKPVSLAVELVGALEHPMLGVPAFGIAARGAVDRMAFGLDALKGAVGDTVHLFIDAEFLHS